MTVSDLKIASFPYTYIIEWTALGRRYIGARYAKGCHPTDLWTKYFTSSEYVTDFVAKHGPPDIVLIDQTFSTGREAIAREQFLQRQFDVCHNHAFLNKAIAGDYDPCDPDIRRRHSLALKGKPKSPAHAAKCRIVRLGKKDSEETKRRKSIARMGKKYALGYRHSEESKRRMSESRSGAKNSRYQVEQTISACPHCGKSGGYAAMARWHFDNCPATGKPRNPGNRLGVICTTEQRFKFGSAMRGKKHSEATKQKISDTLKGKQNTRA